MSNPKYTGIVDLGFGWTIDTWYNLHYRMYVTQLKFEGNQIGDAIYGTKAGVASAVNSKRLEHIRQSADSTGPTEPHAVSGTRIGGSSHSTA